MEACLDYSVAIFGNLAGDSFDGEFIVGTGRDLSLQIQ